MRRVRRPLLALIALLAALAIGYAVRALNSDDHPSPTPSRSTAVVPNSPGSVSHTG